MKTIYASLFLILILASCTSSSKLFQQGNYDAAIQKSVKKLLKKPNKVEEIAVLERAYRLANERDQNVINELRISGQPDIWEGIFARYSNMRRRQDIVSRLPYEILTQINYVKVDYNQEVAEAKNKAAAFYYANGAKLLLEGDRMSARKAYDQFSFINKYFANYRDVDMKIQQALAQGTNHVIFRMQNQARVAIPQDFETEILKITLSSLNVRWLEFDSKFDKDMYYDYNIYLNLKHIEVSPQSIENEKYTETKKVPDGWEYVLDNNGNVMKDSLGYDMKREKYKEVNAYVTLTKMNKKSIVTGTLDYFDNRTGQLIKTTPITSEFIFDYKSATFAGVEAALTTKTKEYLKNGPKPFPTDLQMIFDTNQEIKRVAFEIVKRDRNLFLN